MNELTEIQSFYKGKNIFITGGTGFMGKVLIEKLLYSCSELNKIYVLIRPKRGRASEIRVDEMFKLPVSMNFHILDFRLYDSVSCFSIIASNRYRGTPYLFNYYYVYEHQWPIFSR